MIMRTGNPVCQECGREMLESFESGDIPKRIWKCHRCGRSHPRDNAEWSVKDLLCALLMEQQKANKFLETIARYNEVINVGLYPEKEAQTPLDNENAPQIFDV